MTTQNLNIKQGHSIYIYPEEITFIENTLLEKGINIDCIDKKQNLLNLNQSYVGFIKTPKRIIRLSPKHESVSLNHILRMYFFVNGNFKNFNDKVFDINQSTNYMSIVDMFIQELNKIRRKGLPSDYVEKKEYSKYTKGSVDYVESYKNIKLFHDDPFLCVFDELSLNTPLNSVLLAAFNKISKLNGYRNSLTPIKRMFDKVNVNYDPTTKIMFSSKDFYCKNAYLFAKLILDESFFDNIGNIGGESFLINYDQLFEDFIKKILFVITKDYKFSAWSSNSEYGVYHSIPKSYKPDILYNYNNKKLNATAVIDVKNKFSGFFKNADVFQMLFYSTMLDSNKIIFCYPSTEPKEPEMLRIYSDEFKTDKIYAVYINITSSSKESFTKDVFRFIEDLYKTIERIV